MVSHFLHFWLIFVTFIAVITFMGDTFMREQQPRPLLLKS